jgi:hypothetical protein
MIKNCRQPIIAVLAGCLLLANSWVYAQRPIAKGYVFDTEENIRSTLSNTEGRKYLRPVVQFQGDYGVARPMGAFKRTNSSNSGFAQEGVYWNVLMTIFLTHREAPRYDEYSPVLQHYFGFGAGYHNHKMPVDVAAIEANLERAFETPLAGQTSFFADSTLDNQRWNIHFVSFSLDYMLMVNRWFTFKLSPFVGVGWTNQRPRYFIDQGNYVPEGYGRFFPDAIYESPNARFGWGGHSQIHVNLLTPFSIGGGVSWLNYTQNFLSDAFEVSSNNGRIVVNRRVESSWQSMNMLRWHLSLVMNIGGMYPRERNRPTRYQDEGGFRRY